MPNRCTEMEQALAQEIAGWTNDDIAAAPDQMAAPGWQSSARRRQILLHAARLLRQRQNAPQQPPLRPKATPQPQPLPEELYHLRYRVHPRHEQILLYKQRRNLAGVPSGASCPPRALRLLRRHRALAYASQAKGGYQHVVCCGQCYDANVPAARLYAKAHPPLAPALDLDEQCAGHRRRRQHRPFPQMAEQRRKSTI